jgi:hypothetical protein
MLLSLQHENNKGLQDLILAIYLKHCQIFYNRTTPIKLHIC